MTEEKGVLFQDTTKDLHRKPDKRHGKHKDETHTFSWRGEMGDGVRGRCIPEMSSPLPRSSRKVQRRKIIKSLSTLGKLRSRNEKKNKSGLTLTKRTTSIRSIIFRRDRGGGGGRLYSRSTQFCKGQEGGFGLFALGMFE